MRFYLDENLSWRIAPIARALGIDAIASFEVGLNGVSDEEQFAFAARENRCFVTRDYADFSALTERCIEEDLPHPGILFIASSLQVDEFGTVAAVLAHYDQTHPKGIAPYGVDYLRAAPRT
jgi:hypothetical protein